MLQSVFLDVASVYSDNGELKSRFWNEIAKAYQSKGRHYHSLQHLDHLYHHLTEMKGYIQNWHSVVFSLFYHDFVYNAARSDNEAKSSEVAALHLQQLQVPADLIQYCEAQILATKLHELSKDEDTNYFTDADLSILGQDSETYTNYCQNVRKEYSIYPDLLYRPGRRKVVKHFLAMPRIYKTEFGYIHWEAQARINLQRELTIL
jgi:predicted metal-dependent HD superfamily phosphohydrolase